MEFLSMKGQPHKCWLFYMTSYYYHYSKANNSKTYPETNRTKIKTDLSVYDEVHIRINISSVQKPLMKYHQMVP